MEKIEKTISSDLIRGHIDTIILYSLLDGDKFAQQISDAVDKKSEGKYELNQATLYSCLKRLENLKLVSAYWHDSDNGRRRFFKLTEEGKYTVEQNLSNWTYSRAIIDKLTDTLPDENVKTEVVEKIVTVEKPVYIEKIVEKQVEVPVEVPVALPVEEKKDLKAVENEPISEPIKDENTQEINFRNILNGLIKSTAKQPEIKENLEPITKADYEEKREDKVFSGERDKKVKKAANFNEIISTDKFSPVKIKGTVDFSDMVADAEREGYVLRVSNAEPRVIKGEIFGRKLNFISALAVFIVAILEMLIITSVFKESLKMSALSVVLTLVILAAYPVFATFSYVKNPKKTVRTVKADSILTSSIVVFNLILITFAINLLANANFYDTFTLLAYFVCPSIFFFDILLFFIIRYCFSKTEICSAVDKKTKKNTNK